MAEDFDVNQPGGGSLRPPSSSGQPPAGPPPPPPPPQPELQRPPARRRVFGMPVRAGAVIALAIAVGLVAWFVLRDTGSKNANKTTQSGAHAATVDELANLAQSLKHPIFWLGPRENTTYELTQTKSGKIYVRYLPAGVDVGSSTQYLTVATYPFPGALAALQKVAKRTGSVSETIANDGIAVLDKAHPTNVHAAYPGVDYQVEVFDPTANSAMQAVEAGQLAALGPFSPSAVPKAASVADLQGLAARLGHPVYWAGKKAGSSYELTETLDGKTFIRYLPNGVEVGSKHPYLTVATYPFPGALEALQQTAKGNAAGTIHLPGGGLAVVDPTSPMSIRIAFPAGDVQVEVFDPSPAHGRQIVTSGEITAVS